MQPIWKQVAQRAQHCLPPMRLSAVLIQLPEPELQRELQWGLQQKPHSALAQRALMQTAAARRCWQTLLGPRY